MSNPGGLLDKAGAAEYLGVTPRFIKTLVDERRISFTRVGRFIRFTPAQLQEFVNEHRVEARV